MKGLDDILHLAASGRTSIPVNPEVQKPLYRAAGFRVCGDRAVRVDILERLADLIRPAIQYRPGLTQGEPPAGAADGEGFVVTVAMTSLCGCAGEDFNSILKSLGYVMDRRVGPAITMPLAKPAVPEPVIAAASTESAPAETHEVAADQSDAAEATNDASASKEQVAEPASVETAHVETSGAEQATSDSTPVEATPAEPVMIEVWRQHRHRPHAQRHDRRKSQPHKARAAQAVNGTEAQATGESTKPQDRSQERPHRHHEKRKHEEGEQRRERRPHAKSERDEKRGPRPDGRDRNKDQRRQPDRGWQDPPRARDNNKAPDPDSPFAKLLALKSQMEGKDKG